MFQPPFKLTIAIHWHSRRQLDPAALKALKIRRSKQFAIEARRRNLQNVRPASDRILDIEDRADFAAQAGAILMRHALRLVYKDAQHARFATAAQFNFDYLEAQRTCDPFSNRL